MSMLDVFIAMFVVAGFVALALDRRWIERGEPPPRGPDVPWDLSVVPPAPELRPYQSLGPGAMAASEFDVDSSELEAVPRRVASPVLRWWRLLAGAMLGAAMATKWAGITALAGAGVLAGIWEITRRRRAGRPHPIREAITQESFGLLIAFVLVPLTVYVATYVVWLGDHGWSPTEFWNHHGNIAGFHWNLDEFKENGDLTHPYQARAWTWLLMTRPVSYFYEGTDTTAAEILGMGNPAIFWGSLVAVPAVVVRWIRRRDWAAGLVAAAFLFQYVPWLQVHRPMFLFYTTPLIPFMVLACTLGARSLAEVRTRSEAKPFAPAAGLLIGISVMLFIFFFPILVGDEISKSAWNVRIWFPSWV
jgi:dolichyl-phosphate-mannose--protein O-mannosyl transferase